LLLLRGQLVAFEVEKLGAEESHRFGPQIGGDGDLLQHLAVGVQVDHGAVEGLRRDVADRRQPLGPRAVDVGARLVPPQRLGVGIQDHLAAEAVDDDGHPRPHLVPESLDTDDVGQPQRPRHDGGVRGAPAPFGAEAGCFGATELGSVGRGQLVRDGDAPLGRVLGRDRLPTPHQGAQQALTDQRDVALAVAEVRVLDLLEHRLDLIE